MKYVRNPDVAYRVIDGEAVLVDSKAGTTFVLNAVGSCVWTALENATLDELVVRVRQEFSAEDADARADIEDFLSRLDEKRLVLVAQDTVDKNG